MKIGILSMQRVANYGSFLQSYALMKLLENFGGEKVGFIDIIPGKSAENVYCENGNKELRRGIKKSLLRKLDKDFFKKIYYYINSKFYIANIKKYQRDYLGILEINSKVCDCNYDLVIIGSDEVFNCCQNTSWGFSLQLFGEKIDAYRIITYAASCGFTKVEFLSKKEKMKVTKALSNLSVISVRDNNTFHFVEKLTNKSPLQHLDPVLVYDFKEELKEVKSCWKWKPSQCLVIYAYPGRINEKNEIREIKRFAEKKGLSIVSVGGNQKWCKSNILLSPFEVLWWMKNAAYIITDTFHGTIMSAKFNRRFVVMVRESNRNKLLDLVQKLNIEDAIVNRPSDIANVLSKGINYKKCNRYLEVEKKKAVSYLKENIVKARRG